MQTVAQQLSVIASHVQRAAAERAQMQAEIDALAQQCHDARCRAWQTRKDGGKYARTGLCAAVVARLPAGEKYALRLCEVDALVTDIPHSTEGLSGMLTSLIDQGLIARVGERRKYRYFKNP